jgi:hypothetical protein
MRIAVDLPDDLLRKAESRAASEGLKLGDFIRQTLSTALGEQRAAGTEKVTFPIHRSTRPGSLTSEEVRMAEESSV